MSGGDQHVGIYNEPFPDRWLLPYYAKEIAIPQTDAIRSRYLCGA